MQLKLDRIIAPRPSVQRATPFPLTVTSQGSAVYPHANQIWIIESAQQHKVISSHVHRVTALHCHQNNQLISADERGNVHINSLEGKLLHEFATGMLIRYLVMIPDSPFLFLAGEGRECQAAVLNVETGACSPLAGHAKRINRVCLGNGFILTASDDLTVGVYRPAKKGVEFVRTLKGLHTRFIQSVCHLNGDCFASAASDGFIKVFSLPDGVVTHSWQHDAKSGSAVMALAWSDENAQLLSVGTDGCCRGWTEQGTMLHEFKGTSQLLAITPNGISVNLEGDVISTKDGAILSNGPKAAIKSLMAPSMALTHDGEAYDWQQGKRVPIPMSRWSLSSDGKVHDQAGKEVSKDTAYSIAFDEKRLAIGLERAIYLMPEGKTFSVGLGPITALALCGDYVAYADDQRRVRILSTSEPEKDLSVRWCHHASRVTSLAWQPSDNLLLLASASLDGHIALLDPRQKPLAPVLQIPAGQGTLHSLQWLDPLHLASAGQDGSIRIWQLLPQ